MLLQTFKKSITIKNLYKADTQYAFDTTAVQITGIFKFWATDVCMIKRPFLAQIY